MHSAVRFKLTLMMFLQYAVWGSWAVSMGGYMDGALGFSGVEIGAIYSTTAIAAMISPLYMGYLADRLFATEKMIALLHLVGAGLLTAAATTTAFKPLYLIMLVYALCYMPTLALTNSISFANIGDSQREFPGIRVGGTWGWIVAGWVVGFVLSQSAVKAILPAALAGGNAPIAMAALLSALLGLFSFTLPHTPPRDHGGATPAADAAPGVLQLLRDRSFLVFVVCSFLVCIPLSFYYGFANVFLTEHDAPYPTALQTLGQMSEVGFMAAMPFFIARLGVKRMLAVGMLAWVARYFCFGTLAFPLIIFGLFLHGVCYDFFFVASQIYVDNRVNAAQRASAQSFIAFVTLGVGMFVGAYAGGWTVDRFPPAIQVPVTVKLESAGAPAASASMLDQLLFWLPAEPPPPSYLPLPNWDPEGKTGLAKALGLTADGAVTADALPETFVETNDKTKSQTIYERYDLAAAVTRADADHDGRVTRFEWRRAQEHAWPNIWHWPAIWAAVTCLLFWIGFKNPAEKVLGVAANAPTTIDGPEHA